MALLAKITIEIRDDYIQTSITENPGKIPNPIIMHEIQQATRNIKERIKEDQ